MPESFTPTFKDLEKDVGRHLDRFGVEGTPIMGAMRSFSRSTTGRR